MKYYSQYRTHDLFELQQSLSGLSKSNRWVKLADKTRLTLLRCLQADIQIFLDFLGRHASNLLDCFSRHDHKCLQAAFKMFEQQKMMFEGGVRTCADRIISIYQPHLRLIVRGKAKAKVEFGAKTGLASGAVDAGTHNDLNYLWKDIVGNTISAVGRTLAVDAILGSPHILEIEEGKKAMFRTGGLSSLFSGKGSGLTLGRMAYVQSLNNSTKYHEFYHMQDINRMGWANFYARTLHEYFKYGFPKVYEIKNTLEWNADQYMDYRNKNPL